MLTLCAAAACSGSGESAPELPPWEDAILSTAVWYYAAQIHRSSEGVELWASESGEPRSTVPRGALTPGAEEFLEAQCGVLTPAIIDEHEATSCATADAPIYSLRLEACEGRLAQWCDGLSELDPPWADVNDFAVELFDQMADCREGAWFVPAADCEPLEPY